LSTFAAIIGGTSVRREISIAQPGRLSGLIRPMNAR